MAAEPERAPWVGLLVLFSVASLIEATYYGQISAFTPLHLPNLGVPLAQVPAWTGRVTALAGLVGIPLLPLWGALADRFSRQPIIVRSFAVHLLSGVLMLLAGNLWVFALGRALTGFALGNSGLMMTTLSERAPRARTGFALAVMNSAAPIGAFAGPLFGGPAVDRWGFPTLLAADAVLMLAVIVALSVGYRDSFRATQRKPILPMAMESVGIVIRSAPLRSLFIALFLLFAGWMLVMTYVPLVVTGIYQGPNPATVVGLVLGLGGLSALLVGPLMGALADRFGHLADPLRRSGTLRRPLAHTYVHHGHRCICHHLGARQRNHLGRFRGLLRRSVRVLSGGGARAGDVFRLPAGKPRDLRGPRDRQRAQPHEYQAGVPDGRRAHRDRHPGPHRVGPAGPGKACLPVIPLTLATLFSAAFNLLMRFGQDCQCDMTALGAVNYITAALYNIAVLSATGALGAVGRPGQGPHAASLLVGAAGGCAFVTTYFLLFRHLRRRGVTITMAVTRLAALFPVVVSMVVWRDRTTAVQMAGGAIALVSLPLLSVRPSQGGDSRGKGGILLMSTLFVAQGLCLLAPRVFNQTGIRGEDAYYLAALFGTAALASSSVWVAQSVRARRERPSAPVGPVLVTVILGVVLGLTNTFASQFLVSSLLDVPSILVFPFYSTVGLLITVVFSRIVWRERINRLETAGIVMACAAVVLMNLA